ncbi:hypothetical protein PAPYR_5120 [Paratrimastix pyriformis]|uniref:Uncharacterized protein n=1 Tax=Paratrimastix pyriformis TaxID=342808 RepID=A0ABQ8UP05_9EUKA|nr:hypothetical protein PAPYR_5120 [Paratrimastix pyriformis]
MRSISFNIDPPDLGEEDDTFPRSDTLLTEVGTPVPTATAIAALVGPCSKLEVLELSPKRALWQCGTDVSTYGGWVARAFGEHPTLRTLRLPSLAGLCMEALAHILGVLGAQLEDLAVGTLPGGWEPDPLMRALAASCTALRSLSLRLPAYALPCLRILAPCPTLRTLEVRDALTERLLSRPMAVPRSMHLGALFPGLATFNGQSPDAQGPTASWAHLDSMEYTPPNKADYEGTALQGLTCRMSSRLDDARLGALLDLLAAPCCAPSLVSASLEEVPGAALPALLLALSELPALRHLELTTGPAEPAPRLADAPRLMGRLESLRLGVAGPPPGDAAVLVAGERLRQVTLVLGEAPPGSPIVLEGPRIERVTFAVSALAGVTVRPHVVLRCPSLVSMQGIPSGATLEITCPMARPGRLAGAIGWLSLGAWAEPLGLWPSLRVLEGVQCRGWADLAALCDGSLLPRLACLTRVRYTVHPHDRPGRAFALAPSLATLHMAVVGAPLKWLRLGGPGLARLWVCLGQTGRLEVAASPRLRQLVLDDQCALRAHPLAFAWAPEEATAGPEALGLVAALPGLRALRLVGLRLPRLALAGPATLGLLSLADWCPEASPLPPAANRGSSEAAKGEEDAPPARGGRPPEAELELGLPALERLDMDGTRPALSWTVRAPFFQAAPPAAPAPAHRRALGAAPRLGFCFGI